MFTRKFGFIVLAVVVAIVGALAGLYYAGSRMDADHAAAKPSADAEASVSQPNPQARLEQGRYLATLGNCVSCHTVQGGRPYAGGTPIVTDFGTLYGPNITPHPEAGIGAWSSDDFWRALHNGRAPDGSYLYPAFPFTEYTRMSRDDSDALYAYLMSLEPEATPSRAHTLRFPYDQRALLPFWRGLYFNAGTYTEDPQQDERWNRGRYLVEGPGHCAACHTPRNRLGASIASEQLGGGMIDSLQWWAPALTAHPQAGLGRWEEADIVDLLRTGSSARSTASGPMREVVSASLQHLRDDDAQAIAHYLKSLPDTPARDAGRADPVDAGTMQVGSQLYTQYCVACHQAGGEGKPPAWPPLAGNVTVTAPSPRNTIRMILEGGYAAATQHDPQPHGMPPFAQVLSENDVAALATYIRNSWGNEAGPVNSLAVKRAKGG